MQVMTDLLMGRLVDTPLGTGTIRDVDYQFNMVYVEINGSWHSLKNCTLVHDEDTGIPEQLHVVMDRAHELQLALDKLKSLL